MPNRGSNFPRTVKTHGPGRGSIHQPAYCEADALTTVLATEENPLENECIANTGNVKVYDYFDIKDALPTKMFSVKAVHRLSVDLKNGNTYSRYHLKQSLF